MADETRASQQSNTPLCIAFSACVSAPQITSFLPLRQPFRTCQNKIRLPNHGGLPEPSPFPSAAPAPPDDVACLALNTSTNTAPATDTSTPPHLSRDIVSTPNKDDMICAIRLRGIAEVAAIIAASVGLQGIGSRAVHGHHQQATGSERQRAKPNQSTSCAHEAWRPMGRGRHRHRQ